MTLYPPGKANTIRPGPVESHGLPTVGTAKVFLGGLPAVPELKPQPQNVLLFWSVIDPALAERGDI